MKTEDLKNYIFEQCLTEAKTHPLVMRGAQWVIDQIGGYDGPDAKKLARRMSTGINRTTNKPTAEHVYNAAQFHYGEILRKHSPGMDRPEVYANMRTQLRAHLGLDGEVSDGSPRTSKQESAFNFINGLKRLQEAKKFPPITIEELQSPNATKHHARRGVKHSDPKVAIEALKLAFRLNDAKTAWMGKDHPDQEVRDTAEMSMNMDEN